MIQLDSAQREARAREVRHEVVAQFTDGTHNAFRILFALQWAVAVALAWAHTAPGDSQVGFAAVAGAVLTIPATLFTRAAPRAAWVRHCVALTQMGWSTLFIYLLGGRVEAYFHLFASLTFLALYRDWTLLLSAAAAFFSFPIARIALLPESYSSTVAWWRITEQAAWVAVECAMLGFAIVHSMKSVRRFSRGTADLQLSNESFGQVVNEHSHELERSREHFRLIAETTRAIPFELDLGRGCFTYVGSQAEKLLGIPDAKWREPGFLDVLVPREREGATRQLFDDCRGGSFEAVCTVVTPATGAIDVHWTISCENVQGVKVLRGLLIDVTETQRRGRQMSQGQTLESLGRVAAGVAHEINTSVQFVSDSVRFVRHALKDVPRALGDYRALTASALSGRDVVAAAKLAHATDEAADIDYFLTNAPEALDRALEGIGRVATIAKAMTEFAHPEAHKVDADINRLIESTLSMARNEYRLIARLETAFAELPPVRCHVGEIKQVVLDLVVNAAHAVGEKVAGTNDKGLIAVRTRMLGEQVEISISDSGNGIPEAARNRIFEPFFTTKEVGRGTGQGLALTRTIVVEKHHGSIHFETKTGEGTTFYIRLPVSDAATSADITNKQAAA